jgi:hypothetical protein
MKESKELQYQDLLLEFERWRLKEAKFEIKHLKASLEVLKSQLKLSSLLVEKVISQRDELIFASQGHREKAAHPDECLESLGFVQFHGRAH